MAQYFFDSSALAKRCHPEVGTPKLLAIFAEPDSEVRISKLSFVEVQSVFAMKVRGGAISRSEAGGLRARLIGRHSFFHRFRTLDARQLAVALDLPKQDMLDYFVAADKALGDVATIEGLAVLNPEAT